MKTKQVADLLLQALEHERGGIEVYQSAIECAVDKRLREQWVGYLDQTREHERILVETCGALELDPEAETPTRAVVRAMGKSLVAAMEQAKETAGASGAQLVACECVVLAETKDHFNWTLIGKCANASEGIVHDALQSAYDEVEDQEDEHLYHTRGWCRELWIESLGLTAVLPPPEELRKVTTAVGQARAEQAADLERLVTPQRKVCQ